MPCNEEIKGFPLGCAMAVANAIKTGREPSTDDVAAIDRWRDENLAYKHEAFRNQEIAELHRLLEKYPNDR